jgi:hypothetical protein
VVLSFLACQYLLWAKPFESAEINMMEAFNESVVLIIGIHEIVLLGFVDSFDAKVYVGDSMVFVILFMLAMNFYIVARDFFRNLYWAIKKKCRRRSMLKKMKERRVVVGKKNKRRG